MKLYLVRHAIAAERGPNFPDDSKRPLTPKGVARFRQVVNGLDAVDVRIDLVLTSPLVRARQTAEVLCERLTGKPPLFEIDALRPGAPLSEVLHELAAREQLAAIALVGHEPGMGELAARLIGSRHPIPFRKGGVCRIDVQAADQAGSAMLAWFLTPRLARRLR